MAKYKTLTVATLPIVMMRLTLFILNADTKTKMWWLQQIHNLLDETLMNDGFGTEGQLDPRGDHRD